MINIAVLGHGVVGSGVVEVLDKNAASINRKAGNEIEVKYILDIRDFPDSPYKEKFTKDFSEILNDGDVKIVAEVMGGIYPAFDFVKALLEAGKSVVTSNKELVAVKGAELLKTAKDNNVNFLFEASVGGGIPIIRPLHQCLGANEIDEIAGILNGTTNFILTKMIKDGMGFADALKMAQKLGYAESNPSADVDGHDSCRKICILASLSFGHHVYPENVYTKGISELTKEDIEYAANAGYVIKLIGRASRADGGKVNVMVSPAFIPEESQLARIDDVFNGILVRGDVTGDVVFYGKGAGKLPTASAVISDVIDCAKSNGTIGSLQWQDTDWNNVADYRENGASMYIRCAGKDAEKLCREAFGEIRSLVRKKQPNDEFAFICGEMKEGEITARLETLRGKGIEIMASVHRLEY